MKNKFLTLRTKLMLVTLFVGLSFIIILSFFYYSSGWKERLMEQKIIATNTRVVETTLRDQIDQQKNILKDYSAWDDMYTNIKSRNVDWIKANTESFLQTYKENYFAVYDTKNNYLYSCPQDKKLLNPDIIKKLKGNYGNFFIMEDSIIVHVSWSIVTTTADTGRISQGVGYLFIAKNWDSQFISNLSNKTGLSVFLNEFSEKNSKSIDINHNLTDIDGKVISDIHFQEENPIYRSNIQEKLIFVISVVGILTVLLIFWLNIRRHISRPISLILRALETGDISVLKKIRSDAIDDEWDIIAKLVEDNVKNTRDLKEQVATKNKFFDLIAHDLRSPFNVIMGFAEILLEEVETLTLEELKKYLKLIFQSANNANELLNQLLEWARLQTGRWNANPQSFNINKLIENIVSLNESGAIQKKIHLISNFKDSFVVVNADENMIGTVVRNIISNAIKFTEPNGFVKIDAKKNDNDVTITISDNGKGMSVDTLNSLFKMGEVMIVQDTTGKKGTGLGLILCKELLEKNGGKLWVESELGKGSKFYFTIPLA
jgi:signal transduction histidine kinase